MLWFKASTQFRICFVHFPFQTIAITYTTVKYILKRLQCVIKGIPGFAKALEVHKIEIYTLWLLKNRFKIKVCAQTLLHQPRSGIIKWPNTDPPTVQSGPQPHQIFALVVSPHCQLAGRHHPRLHKRCGRSVPFIFAALPLLLLPPPHTSWEAWPVQRKGRTFQVAKPVIVARQRGSPRNQ